MPRESSETRRWTIYRGADAVTQDEGFEPVRWEYPSQVEPELRAGEEVEVMPVSEHEAALAEAEEWANSSEHPNWEAGWLAGRARALQITDEMVARAWDAYWDWGPPFTAAGAKTAMRKALEAALHQLGQSDYIRRTLMGDSSTPQFWESAATLAEAIGRVFDREYREMREHGYASLGPHVEIFNAFVKGTERSVRLAIEILLELDSSEEATP